MSYSSAKNIPAMNNPALALQLDVLQQFRVIYGSMRQYFKELEDRCGLPGSQTWILQEVDRSPEIGVTDLARLMGIHQSTCSGLVDKLVTQNLLFKQKLSKDQRRIGLSLTEAGRQVISRLPGPAEGVLPKALSGIPVVCLKTLNANLDELIRHLPMRNDDYATTPLAEMIER